MPRLADEIEDSGGEEGLTHELRKVRQTYFLFVLAALVAFTCASTAADLISHAHGCYWAMLRACRRGKLAGSVAGPSSRSANQHAPRARLPRAWWAPSTA
jgi:hypothetical protein